MSNTQRNLVVVITHGMDHELSSVAFTIANGGMTAGLKVSVFLTSAGIDIARKRASDVGHARGGGAHKPGRGSQFRPP